MSPSLQPAQLSDLLDAVRALPRSHHAPSTPSYRVMDQAARTLVGSSELRLPKGAAVDLGVFGELSFPYHRMGAVDSLDLFGLDELLLFAFYDHNRTRYRRAVDVGANIGLHSILMSRCGWAVTAYEPDPRHAETLEDRLARNACAGVKVIRAAVSSAAGDREFVRVLGNTTSSHLAGAKANPYGDLERFGVHVEAADVVLREADFAKIDAEGEEAAILTSISQPRWATLDVMVEVGSQPSAIEIFDRVIGRGVAAFSQKTGWRRVERIDDMPSRYQDGSLFLSGSGVVPWPESA